MKNKIANGYGQETPFTSFTDFWRAVVNLDFRGMGVRGVLTALIKMAGSRNGDDKLGLESTLSCFDIAESIRAKALAGDKLAFAELLALGTIFSSMITEVAEQKPELVKPFAEASVTWPIVLPYYEDADNNPQARLRALGFGAKAKSLGLRSFRHNFGLLALLLHLFGILRKVCSGTTDNLNSGSATVGQATAEWHHSALTHLEASVGRLSSLTLPEVDSLRKTRSAYMSSRGKKAEVSGEVRYRIKQWFLALHPQVHSWLSLANRSNKA
jgi:hypothetical protein